MQGPDMPFWTEGKKAYLKALKEEEESVLESLLTALANETDPAIRENLNQQIDAIRADFKAKKKAADSSLFAIDR